MKYLRGKEKNAAIKVMTNKKTIIDYLPIIFTILLLYVIPM